MERTLNLTAMRIGTRLALFLALSCFAQSEILASDHCSHVNAHDMGAALSWETQYKFAKRVGTPVGNDECGELFRIPYDYANGGAVISACVPDRTESFNEIIAKTKREIAACEQAEIVAKRRTQQPKKAPTKSTDKQAKTSGTIETDTHRYEGEMWYGQPHGFGKYSYSNGSSLEGRFALGSIMDGEDYVVLYTTGNKYRGQLMGKKRHGQGTWTTTSGFKYVGGWKDDEFHGQGTKSWADGSKESGNWNQGEYVQSAAEKKRDEKYYFCRELASAVHDEQMACTNQECFYSFPDVEDIDCSGKPDQTIVLFKSGAGSRRWAAASRSSSWLDDLNSKINDFNRRANAGEFNQPPRAHPTPSRSSSEVNAPSKSPQTWRDLVLSTNCINTRPHWKAPSQDRFDNQPDKGGDDPYGGKIQGRFFVETRNGCGVPIRAYICVKSGQETSSHRLDIQPGEERGNSTVMYRKTYYEKDYHYAIRVCRNDVPNGGCPSPPPCGPA